MKREKFCPMLRNAPPDTADIAALKGRATNLRRHMLAMASMTGQGYIGQGLGIADVLAALYFHELRYDPQDVGWPERDRFLLSTGHYSIGLWAALAEAGIIPVEELSTYGADGSRLEMSTLDSTPGVEMIGGSLGHGLGQAVGQALGLRLSNSAARVFCELSDGEMEEGSTWEAAMSAGHFGLDGLVALIDCNGIQADGPIVINIEPVAEKWRAFGWDTIEIDGNDMNAIVGALMLARSANGKPKAIVLRTLPGKGVPRIETSEKSHFFRIDVSQWDAIRKDFELSVGAGS
jgi:transketolase